jgi:hypothetical protein
VASRRLASRQPGKAFEERVVDAYRALGYQVTPDTQMPGKQTDLIARREVEGGPPMTLVIECKDHRARVGNQAALAFIARVVAQHNSSRVSGGVLVSSSGFTPSARAAASNEPLVQLLSWEDLTSQVLDVRHQMRELVSAYESSAIYHEYVPVAIETLSWSTLTSVDATRRPMDDVISQWIARGRPGRGTPNALFALADFGAGKTTLLRHLEYDRARAYLAGEDSRIPLFVSLREFRNTRDVAALLRSSFRETYYRDLTDDLFRRRMQDGQFYVLLDGFDEMTERSDGRRRRELLHSLLPALRTSSPAILTSRPSHFVDQGELEALLALLRNQEAALRAPSLLARGGNAPAADRLRRTIVARRRDAPLPRRLVDPVNPRTVRVIQLMPLDGDRIEAFVRRRAAELEAAQTSPEALMAFIRRIYDLTDLASRPLLLTLIIDSVVDGGLRVDDTDVEYGPSGLYEIYTHAKLDLDLAKGPTRRGGLSLQARRLLAEATALEMYRANTLEIDVHQLLSTLLRNTGTVSATLRRSGLSPDEIVTDFATCSFVTLDQDGRCRFVHKSFRAFFVARVLKEHLRKGHPLLSSWLDQDVLYFLGGFAPTDRMVAQRLWSAFQRAGPDDLALRRNALVAFLYTRPDHDVQCVADGEIADAAFGRLGFVGTRMQRVSWRGCTVARLNLGEVEWRHVALKDSHVAELTTRSGSVDLKLAHSGVEALTMTRTRGRLALQRESAIERCQLDECDVSLTTTAKDVRVGHVSLRRSGLRWSTHVPGPVVEQVDVDESRMSLCGAWSGTLRASGSVISCDDEPARLDEWTLTDSVVVLRSERPTRPARRTPQLRALLARRGPDEARSVLIAMDGVTPALLAAVPWGVFGVMTPLDERSSLSNPSAWGVVCSERPPADHGDAAIRRHGDLLLAQRDWYERATSPDGRLSNVPALAQLVADATFARTELTALLDAVRRQYDALVRELATPELDRATDRRRSAGAAKARRARRRSPG